MSLQLSNFYTGICIIAIIHLMGKILSKHKIKGGNQLRVVLFDLDGTLLPMDQKAFTRAYLGELGRKGADLGYGAKEIVHAVMAGLEIMIGNDGSQTNEERFWEHFLGIFGGEKDQHSEKFDLFYQNEFKRVIKATNPTPLAKQYVDILQEKGYELVLATNPIFPKAATYERMRWIDLTPQDFSLVTTYDNSRFTKPNLNYYRGILEIIGAEPEECLMIGNDVQEDMGVKELGMEVFLVIDDLINSTGEDISHCPQGDRQDLLQFLLSLPQAMGWEM